jgi:hypothetical protein
MRSEVGKRTGDRGQRTEDGISAVAEALADKQDLEKINIRENHG